MKIPNEQFWKVFKNTEGAFSCSEAIALYNICSWVSDGGYLELGSYNGKSAMAAAAALKKGRFYLVDPIFEDKELASSVSIKVHAAANDLLAVYTICGYSTNEIVAFKELKYCLIDSGSHGDGLPMQEVKLLEDRVVSGGIIAFHDFRSQFIEVEQAYNYLLSTGKYEEIKIDWDEINKYVIENDLEAGNKSWHHTELATPNFLGALKIK